MAPLTDDTRLARAPELLRTEFPRETLLMSLEAGRYYGLEGTARRVWDLLEAPCSLQELLGRLGEEYDASPERLSQDVRGFLEELIREGIVVAGP